MTPGPLRLGLEARAWTMREPFVTAAERIDEIHVLTVTLDDGRHRGRAETMGVDYLGETPATIAAELEGLRTWVEETSGDLARARAELQELLAAGGARNGLDCALWDLEAKRSGRRAWELAGIELGRLTTLYTLPLGSPGAMAAKAREAAAMPHLKLKLDREDPEIRLAAVRAARPDARLVIDANGGWDRGLMERLAPSLVEHRVELLEQPLPVGADAELAGFDHPVPLCADESFQSSADLERLAPLYDGVNVKLDKCGGLTDALSILERCRELGKEAMVGNMLGSSLAMAPALVVGAAAAFVDLDGPLLQADDHDHALAFDGARIEPPARALWG